MFLDLGIKEFTVEYLESIKDVIANTTVDTYHGSFTFHFVNGIEETVYDGAIVALWDYIKIRESHYLDTLSFGDLQRWKAEHDDPGWFVSPVDNEWIENEWPKRFRE